MNDESATKLLVSGLALALVAGCQSLQPSGSASRMDSVGIPRVTALYEKATAQRHNVHRFRKPYRDEQARLLIRLEKECDRMLADVQTWGSSAELTAAGETEQKALRDDMSTLQTSLEGLRTAAAKADTSSMRSAHARALDAYARIQKKMNLPDR